MALPVMDKAHGDHHVGPGSVQASPLSVLLTVPDSQTILEDDILQHTSLMCVCVRIQPNQKLSNIYGWCFRRDDGVIGPILVVVITKSPQITSFILQSTTISRDFKQSCAYVVRIFVHQFFQAQPPMRRTMATVPR